MRRVERLERWLHLRVARIQYIEPKMRATPRLMAMRVAL